MLQVPVAHEGRLLVDEAYLQKYLVDFGNEKMEANWARTARLHQLFMEQLLSQQVDTSIAVLDCFLHCDCCLVVDAVLCCLNTVNHGSYSTVGLQV